MSLIKQRELIKEIGAKGAHEVAGLLVESLKAGELAWNDCPPINQLWEIFAVDRADGKTAAGSHITSNMNRLRGDKLFEESVDGAVDIGAFTTVCSQLLFNALTTVYQSADLTLGKLVKKIPSTFINGEVFAGVSNVGGLEIPTPFNADLPDISPTEDVSRAPAQQRYGRKINLGFDVLTSDRTGEFMHLAEKMFERGAISYEIDVANVLAGIATRANYNWQNVVYAPYQSSAPWVNLKGSNPLSTDPNGCIQPLQLLLDDILDPFTGLPLMTPPGTMKLVVTPENYNIARILAKETQYRSGASATSYQTLTETGLPHEMEPVKSKYLNYALLAASQPTSTYFYGHMHAISKQESMDVTTSQALPGSYSMWSRGIAAAFKYEHVYSLYWFQPRLMTKSTVGA